MVDEPDNLMLRYSRRCATRLTTLRQHLRKTHVEALERSNAELQYARAMQNATASASAERGALSGKIARASEAMAP